MADWRIQNCKMLRGVKLQRKRYRKPSESWNHDHCAACWATFAEFDGPEIQHYDWVCVRCFSELKDEMGWMEVK
jgi:hypothetical protein